MYAIGEEVNINCVDTSNTAEQVEWLNSTGTVLISSLSSTVTLNIDTIMDEYHGRTYTCRIHSSETVHDINYNIIVLGMIVCIHYFSINFILNMNYICIVPPTPIVIQINPSRYGPQTTGSRLTLTCIAVKTVTGLTLPVETLWSGPNGTELMTSDTIVVADATVEPLRTIHTITLTSLAASHAGVYNCEVALPSPALTTPYQTTTSYTVFVSCKSHQNSLSLDVGSFMFHIFATHLLCSSTSWC